MAFKILQRCRVIPRDADGGFRTKRRLGPHPPHNGNKIRRPTSGFGRSLLFIRGSSVRPKVAD
eukprot:6189531-Pleurochrysis_carterae.AAC.4